MRSSLFVAVKNAENEKKPHAILSVLAAILVAVALLPLAVQPAFADDPVIVESLEGTVSPALGSIAVLDQTPSAPTVTLSSTDPVFEAGGTSLNSDATWYLKQSDGTWKVMPSDQPYTNGAYRYHVCVVCPNKNYSFSDTATLDIDGETWIMIKKEKLSDGREYAIFASPEINLPDEQLPSPEPLKRTGETLTEYGISWTKVDGAKGYEIYVKNTSQGFSPKEKTFEVSASTTTYDLKDVFKSTSIRTGHNTFIVTVKALAPAGYKDSEPASSPTADGSQWAFKVEKHLNLTVDSAAGTVSWDPYPFEEAKFYYYKLVYGTPDGKKIVDGYYDSSITTFYIDSNIEYFHGDAGKYFLYVIAMDRMKADDGWELTEQDFVDYAYTPKVKTISVNGVTQPMEGESAQAYINDYSVEEAHLYLPEAGYGSAYWRRHVSGTWIAMEPAELFEASGEYRISIPVHCDEGYTFATNPTVSVNGKTVAAEVDLINETTVRIECPMDVIAKSDNVYVVTAGALNVRSDASTSSTRLGGLSFGDVVQATGQSGIWTRIEYEGQTAWVNTSYLALTASEEAAFVDGPVKYTVTAGTMNVRSTPETPTGDGNRIGGISAGKEVLATGSVTDDEGREWITMDYYDDSYPENGHRLGYVMFSRPNSASSSGTTYYFNGSDLPPTKSSGKEDTASDELVIDTGKYPKVSFEPLKAVISVGDTASLTDENFENKGDGYLLTTVFPDDAKNFASLTKDQVKLPEVFAGMEVSELTLNDDGSVTLKLGPVNPVTVTFESNGGSDVMSQTVSSGNAISEPEPPTKEGFTFDAWCEDEELKTEYDFSAVVDADKTLYARWIDDSPAEPEPAKKATLTFDLNGGTLDGKTGSITIEANVGDTIELPDAPTREGYTFAYWKGSEYEAGAEYEVEGDHDFTAEWEEEADDTSDDDTTDDDTSSSSASKSTASSGNSSSTHTTGTYANRSNPRTGDDRGALVIPLAAAAGIAFIMFIVAARRRSRV